MCLNRFCIFIIFKFAIFSIKLLLKKVELQSQSYHLLRLVRALLMFVGSYHSICIIVVIKLTSSSYFSAIQYLFPSGLFDIGARPVMKPPEQLFPSMTAVKFDESGRPLDSLFYTLRPNFHRVLSVCIIILNNIIMLIYINFD